jgi:hypothetical protein
MRLPPQDSDGANGACRQTDDLSQESFNGILNLKNQCFLNVVVQVILKMLCTNILTSSMICTF